MTIRAEDVAAAQAIQVAAAHAGESQVRLVAGPGSGKSSTIEERVRWLLESGVKPRKIAVVSFTNASVIDLRLVIAEAYETHRQGAEYGMTMAVRSSTPPEDIVAAVRKELAALEPSVAMYDVRTLEEVVARSMSRQRFTTWLVSVFAIVALSLAAVGVYGVVAFSVSRRTREIGVRVALGATRRQIVALVLREAGSLVGAGLLVGLAAAAFGGRAIRTLLFQTAPADPLTYIVVITLLAATAVLAAMVPARRALSVQPTEALRYE